MRFLIMRWIEELRSYEVIAEVDTWSEVQKFRKSILRELVYHDLENDVIGNVRDLPATPICEF